MSIRTAEHAGFCFGVERAVDMVESLLESGEKVCTLGPLIHNPQVVESFKKRGVLLVNTPQEVPEGYQVVIRSHGVTKDVLLELEEGDYKVANATCPYVTKIHKIVQEAYDQSKFVLIMGDETHPEVRGIASYCSDQWRCFTGADELQSFLLSNEFSVNISYILTAQTTFREKEWQECRKLVENVYTNVKIFDTICSATMLRQEAAAELAGESDCMIVVGGYNSSNTEKLAKVCQSYCPTIRIESPDELAGKDFRGMLNIGVTAGASTPAFIIKEVQKIMSDVVNNKEEMSFEEMLDQSFKTVSAREKVTAIVTSVAPNEIAVDIGTKHAGYVPLYEYTDDPNADLEKLVKPGDEIELLVLRLNDAEGTALLSKKRLDAIAGFEKIVEAEENNQSLTGKVVDIVKGGVIALTNGVRVFIPASQASVIRGIDLETLRGQEVKYKVLETNRNRRRAVGSIRAIQEEEREQLAKEFWENVEVGQVHKGTVKSLTSYGAFIDLGGVDGMAHISELSWTRINHPSDVVSVGDEVEVIIKEVDREAQRISLGYKEESDNPWNILARDYRVGDIIKVKIVSLTDFGAFAQVIPGIDGLIHISQISHDRIERPSDVLAIGQEVDVVITDIDFERNRVSLSIRALLEEPEKDEEKEPEMVPTSEDAELVGSFGPEDSSVEEAEEITEEQEDAEETESEEEVASEETE